MEGMLATLDTRTSSRLVLIGLSYIGPLPLNYSEAKLYPLQGHKVTLFNFYANTN